MLVYRKKNNINKTFIKLREHKVIATIFTKNKLQGIELHAGSLLIACGAQFQFHYHWPEA